MAAGNGVGTVSAKVGAAPHHALNELGIYRVFRDAELVRDFAMRKTVKSSQREDLPAAIGQCVDRRLEQLEILCSIQRFADCRTIFSHRERLDLGECHEREGTFAPEKIQRRIAGDYEQIGAGSLMPS